MQTSVLIMDPQYLTRQGLFHLLDQKRHVHVTAVQQFSSSENLANFDVIITDYLEPYSHAERVADKEFLLKNTSNNFLVISSDRNKKRIRELITAGVKGYLTKDCQPEEILSAIHMISKGNRFYCNKVLELLTDVEGSDPDDCVPTNLSAREVEVLKLIATGYSTAKISDTLHISIHTVNSHRKNILKKLKLGSPIQLVAYAHELGLV